MHQCVYRDYMFKKFTKIKRNLIFVCYILKILFCNPVNIQIFVLYSFMKVFLTWKFLWYSKNNYF
jgi:hypothetical protein